jgi:acyl-coenzyme A thioesterase 13
VPHCPAKQTDDCERTCPQFIPRSNTDLLAGAPERRRRAMDPEAVRRTLEPTASPEDISGSTPYDSFVISGVRLDAAQHGRVLCSFLVTPRHAVSHPLAPCWNI